MSGTWPSDERGRRLERTREEQYVGLWRIEIANARAHAAAKQEAAVARCRSSAAAALDNARADAENRCERLVEGFVRERDRAAVAELVLRIGEPSCGKSRPWSLNFKTRRLACRPGLMSLSSNARRAPSVSSTRVLRCEEARARFSGERLKPWPGTRRALRQRSAESSNRP